MKRTYSGVTNLNITTDNDRLVITFEAEDTPEGTIYTYDTPPPDHITRVRDLEDDCLGSCDLIKLGTDSWWWVPMWEEAPTHLVCGLSWRTQMFGTRAVEVREH